MRRGTGFGHVDVLDPRKNATGFGTVGVFDPRKKMYDTAGIARHYSMGRRWVPVAEIDTPSVRAETEGGRLERVDDGHVLMVDLDAMPHVTFDAKGRAIGIAAEVLPTKLDEYENAERMVEIWAKRAMTLREELRQGIP